MLLEIITNPNVAYLLLWGGLTLALLAILSPGTGVLEIGALMLLALAGYSIFNIEINYWALGLILLGVFFFLLAIRYPKQWFYLAGAITLLVVGSIFLFREENWWDPAVNPFLALVVSGLTAVFFWFATRKVLEARSEEPVHDMESLLGAVGEARTAIYREGSVLIESELWSAVSDEVIPRGSMVRVVDIDGFKLVVEPLTENNVEGISPAFTEED